MCDCVEPPKGKQAAAPTPENVEEYRAAYGDMILAKLVGEFAPEAPAAHRGGATHVSYGRRQKGEIFYIWEADLLNTNEYERIENYATEPEVTAIPPEPPNLLVETDDSPVFEPLAEISDYTERVAKVSTPVKPRNKPGRKPKSKAS